MYTKHPLLEFLNIVNSKVLNKPSGQEQFAKIKQQAFFFTQTRFYLTE